MKTPSFFKIRLWILIIGILIICFLIGSARQVFADTGTISGNSTGDIININGVCYELTTIYNTYDNTCTTITNPVEGWIFYSAIILRYLVILEENVCGSSSLSVSYEYWAFTEVDCNTAPTDSDGDGYTSDEDCDDTDNTIYPGATEICGDGIDQDCDGSDEECGTTSPDNDGDGYTVAEGDCDDTDPDINPGEYDICEDGIDQNCNGSDAECSSEEIGEIVIEIDYTDLSDTSQEMGATFNDFSYGARFNRFIEDMKTTGIFNIMGSPAEDIPNSGSPEMTIDLGSYGQYDYSFETMSSSLAAIRGVLLICTTWISIKILVLKK